jgi:tRNA-specific 2-thiouridylase
MFPLGELTKSEVREIAAKANLHVCNKEESQDFYSGDYRNLIDDRRESSANGRIVDTNENVIGLHSGIWNYTVGQRKGLGVTGRNPMYVVEIRADSNTVVVGEKDDLKCKHIIVTEFNQLEEIPQRAECKVRSSAQTVNCSAAFIDNMKVRITFEEPIIGACPGQSAVLYNGEIVIGGGLIEQAMKE